MYILVIEDENKVAGFIKKGLEEQSYTVDIARDGLKGHILAVQNEYDIIVLDIMLPGQNGWETCRKIREDGISTPILMLTSLDQTEQKVKGLNLGADDYLSKPFEFAEFLARIRALMRRNKSADSAVLQVADLTLDPAEHTVKRDDKLINLTNREFALLEYLMRNRKRVLTRTQIAEHVWGIDFDRDSNVVDAYIKLLRQKIDKGFSKNLIHTVIGMGYVLKEEM
jgi:two-component system copper resistance phosphate regulon response regulator CusR